jgi:lia operon protein LiaG
MMRTLRSKLPALGSFPTILLATACSTADAGAAAPSRSADATMQAETRTLSGDRVAIYNLAGAVEVVGSTGTDVVVEIMRRGGDADRLDIRVDDLDGRQSLRVIYPEDRISYSESPRGGRSRIRVRSDGTFGRGGIGLFGRRVTISDSGRGLEAWADLRITVPEERNVAVYVGVGQAHAEGVRGSLRLDTSRGSVDVANTGGSLVVDTGSGSIDVRQVEGDVNLDAGSGSIRLSGVAGDAELDTGSGSVDVRNVEGERLAVDTGSGSVRGGALTIRELDVDTGSGGVRLDDVAAADIRVDTGSGRVTLDLVRDVDRLEIDTGSGSVNLSVPRDFGADVTVDTGSGGISADVPLQIRSSRRGWLEGTIGDGRGRLDIETGSGGVRIESS